MHTNIYVGNDDKIDSLGMLSAMRYLPSYWGKGGDTFSVIRGFKKPTDEDFLIPMSIPIMNHYVCFDMGGPLQKLGVDNHTVPSVRQSTFHAHGKSTQNRLLNAYAKSMGLKNYHNVINISRDYGEIDPSKSYILKPQFGARGIGQLRFKGHEITMDGLKRAINKISNAGNSDDGVKEAGYRTKIAEEVFSEYLNRPVTFNSEMEQDPDEGINILLSGWCVTEQIPNIKNEYRIIINGTSTDICYGIKRGIYIKDGCHAQATGSTEPMNEAFQGVEKFPENSKKIAQEIKDFIKYIYAPLHSLDIFITEDGKWGVLEISPNFGGVAVPDRWIREAAMSFFS
jgi:hypothetical protein